jgi:hypothetical protein
VASDFGEMHAEIKRLQAAKTKAEADTLRLNAEMEATRKHLEDLRQPSKILPLISHGG